MKQCGTCKWWGDETGVSEVLESCYYPGDRLPASATKWKTFADDGHDCMVYEENEND